VAQTHPGHAIERLPRPPARRKKQVVVQAACMAEERETLAAILREYGFAAVEPEDGTVTVDEYLGHLRDEVDRCEEAVAEARAKLAGAAAAKKKDVEIALGYWEERLRTASAVAKLAESKRLTILRGYVRARELEEFRRRVSDELPDVGVEVREPTPDEAVPVSLRNPKLLAPAQFLISMLGMPNYFTFDPTPVVFFNFVIFFGICFGDLAYGIGLIALGILLARKYREYPGLRHLFTLLGYAGITTAVVGVLTGSWAGNLFSADWFGSPNPFFSASNPLVVLNGKCAQMDLLQRLIIALVLALMIGIVNQMIGMVCLMISNVKKRDPLGAVLDSVFWLMMMPALVVLVATMFSSGMPPSAVKVAWGAVAVSVAGLVLTQGRAQKNIVARLGLGVVSLYGVVGTYGCSAFLSDTLSYSRLLALGLVTGIIGMCFNIMADLARGIPWLGIPLALLILVGGHGANFMLSILGSFVHSARLIFVEFFGRFYQGDAPTFAPLGTWSGRVRVTDARTVWAD